MPGLGKMPDTAHSAGRTGAAVSGLSSSTLPTTASFRAGWQSLMATLSSNMAITGEADADQGSASAGPAAGQIPEKSTAQVTGSQLRQGQGTEKESVETGVLAKSSSVGAGSQALTAEPAAVAAKPASARSVENDPARKPGSDSATESTRSSSPARSIHATKTDSIPDAPLPGLVPAAMASLSPAVPKASVVNQVAQSTDEPAQLAHREISSAFSKNHQDAVASASLDEHPQAGETPVNHIEAVNATKQQTTEGTETSSRQRQASPVSNLSGSSGSTLSETESAVAVAQNANPAETLTPSHAPSQTLVSNHYRTPTIVQSQEQVAIQQGNQGTIVLGAPIPGDGLNPLSVTASAAAQTGQLSAQSTAQSKPGSAGSGKPESIRGIGSSVQHVSHLNVGQSSVPAVDASAMARSLAGAGGTMSTSGERAGDSSTAATGPDSREAFATLDAAGAPVATTWIHAGTQKAEAGYQDPALGWVGVRADLSGGGVHAQLVPGSADAAQALGGHLEGLNAYLAEHHTPVDTLTLSAPEGGWSGLGSGQGTGEGMQQESGQGTAQGADTSTPSGQYSEPVIQPPVASSVLPAFFGDMDGSKQASLDGSHISVMA